jgi:hypothetical protein
VVYRQQFAARLGAVEAGDGGLQAADARGGEDEAVVVDQPEGDLWMGEGEFAEDVVDVAVLGGRGFEEFAPGRGVEEEIGDGDDRACAPPASRTSVTVPPVTST